MPATTTERMMSGEERQYIQGLLDGLPTVFGEFRRDAGVWISGWGMATALLAGAWFVVAWLVRATIGIDIWAGRSAILVAAILTAFYFVFEVKRSIRHRSSFRRSLQAELAGNRVVEEQYEFTDAMRMQEQEHGGLIYFLRGTDGAVLVLYDTESQDIGVQGDDPLTSSFRPHRSLNMVRAPVTGLVIDKTFSGEPLEPGKPLDLLAPPGRWPEDEEECDIPWEKLEAEFCS